MAHSIKESQLIDEVIAALACWGVVKYWVLMIPGFLTKGTCKTLGMHADHKDHGGPRVI